MMTMIARPRVRPKKKIQSGLVDDGNVPFQMAACVVTYASLAPPNDMGHCCQASHWMGKWTSTRFSASELMNGTRSGDVPAPCGMMRGTRDTSGMAGPEENQDKQRWCLARSASPEFLHLHRNYMCFSPSAHPSSSLPRISIAHQCLPSAAWPWGKPTRILVPTGTEYLPIVTHFSPRPQASTVEQYAKCLTSDVHDQWQRRKQSKGLVTHGQVSLHVSRCSPRARSISIHGRLPYIAAQTPFPLLSSESCSPATVVLWAFPKRISNSCWGGRWGLEF